MEIPHNLSLWTLPCLRTHHASQVLLWHPRECLEPEVPVHLLSLDTPCYSRPAPLLSSECTVCLPRGCGPLLLPSGVLALLRRVLRLSHVLPFLRSPSHVDASTHGRWDEASSLCHLVYLSLQSAHGIRRLPIIFSRLIFYLCSQARCFVNVLENAKPQTFQIFFYLLKWTFFPSVFFIFPIHVTSLSFSFPYLCTCGLIGV